MSVLKPAQEPWYSRRRMFQSSYHDKDGTHIREGDYILEIDNGKYWEVSQIEWPGDCLISRVIEASQKVPRTCFHYLNNCFITEHHKRDIKIIGTVYSNFDVNEYIKNFSTIAKHF